MPLELDLIITSAASIAIYAIFAAASLDNM